MKVTDIKQQLKRSDRYSIFIDGKYSFSLSGNELLTQGLKIGREFTSEEFAAVKNDAVIDKGVYRVLDLLSRRPRSRWEIEDYLKRKSYDSKEMAKIIIRLEGKGYIDDLNFAKRWVENRRLLKFTSKRKLQMELKQKRVAGDIIEKVLDEDEADEHKILSELIGRKRQQSRYKDDQKLIAYLARQGFNYGDIKSVMDELT